MMAVVGEGRDGVLAADSVKGSVGLASFALATRGLLLELLHTTQSQLNTSARCDLGVRNGGFLAHGQRELPMVGLVA